MTRELRPDLLRLLVGGPRPDARTAYDGGPSMGTAPGALTSQGDVDDILGSLGF